MSLKTEQVEPQFAQKLESGVPLKNIVHELFGYSIPEDFEAEISLRDAKGRKQRSDAPAEKWPWESGRIELRFRPKATGSKESTRNLGVTTSSSTSSANNDRSRSETDLLRVLVGTLDRAESRPGWNFVPLKKFRDEILPAENTALMRTDLERQNLLRSAIDKRLVLVGRVPNPKAPEFPVTTIRLNRLMPEVRQLLGQAVDADLDFHPVEIRGEPLSATILRERR